MAAQTAAKEVVFFSTLSILQVIKDAQQQHGLRHADYQRYRGYCARRLRRVRKSLHFTHIHKHKSAFQCRRVTVDSASELRFLMIPLFEAERSWAYAMQLKQEANTELRKRFHVVNKLKRALQHAQELENICKSLDKVDAPTKLESQAYCAWIQGCFYFETKEWSKATESLTTSKKIYENLSKIVAQSEDSSVVDVYHQRCQEIIPQLRYCAFSSGDESAGTVDDLIKMRAQLQAESDQADSVLMTSDLDKLIGEARAKQAATTANKLAMEIKWCGYKIPNERPPRVQTFLGNVQQFEAELKQALTTDAKIALYERFLIDCRDAIQAMKDDAKTETLKLKRVLDDGDTISNDTQLSASQILYSYLVYVRLSNSINRYLLMIDQLKEPEKSDGKSQSPSNVPTNAESATEKKGKKKKQLQIAGGIDQQPQTKSKPLDLARFYDVILQHLMDMNALPGVNNDEAFLAKLEAKLSYFRAFRCCCLAESFGNQKKWHEALALYDRSLKHGQVAKTSLQKIKFKSDDQMCMSSLEQVIATANSSKYSAQANAISETSSNNALETADVLGKDDKKPISETVDVYRRINPTDLAPARLSSITAPPVLVRLPPDFQAMPCKPMFFDLALNHVQFPSLEEKLEQLENEARAAQGGSDGSKGGITGIMKGWLWGTKK